MNGLDELQAPASFDDFKNLIWRLYNPAFSEQVQTIQKRIQAIQSTTEAWTYADELLGCNEQTLRFFGALTFTVKINQESLTLSAAQCEEILEKLVTRFMLMVSHGEARVVTYKLSSTLATFFTIRQNPWRKCIQHLLCCLSLGRFVPEKSIVENSTVEEAISALDVKLLSGILIFITTFAEDMRKVEHDSVHFSFVQERVEQNVEDISRLLACSFPKIQKLPKISQEDLYKGLESWLLWPYIHQRTTSDGEFARLFQALFSTLIAHLQSEETFEIVVNFFLAIFTEDEMLLDQNMILTFYNLFLSQWADSYFLSAKKSEDDFEEETVLFAKCFLTFIAMERTASRLVKSNPAAGPIFDRIHLLSRNISRHPFNESLAVLVTTFWEVYLDVDQDCEDEDLLQRHYPLGLDELSDLIKLSPSIDSASLVADDSLLEFRRSVKATIQESCSTRFTAAATVYALINRVVEGNSDWAEIEAALFLLSGLDEYIDLEMEVAQTPGLILPGEAEPNNVDMHRQLRRLFGSQIFAKIADPAEAVPLQIRKWTMRLIAEQHEFLACNEGYLLSAVDFLFKFLQLGKSMDDCAQALFRLCESRKHDLVYRMEYVLEMSADHFLSAMSTTFSKECIIGAAAAIISALPSQEAYKAVQKLLDIVEKDLQYAFSKPSTNYIKQSREAIKPSITGGDTHELAVEATLIQLTKMGKAFQTPDDAAINLDEDDNEDSFWALEDGLKVQTRIVQLLQILLDGRHSHGAVLEGACNVLKAGYPEKRPGPFVFQPQVTVDLLTATPLTNNMLYVGINTASAFVSSHSSEGSRVEQAVSSLLQWVCQIAAYFSSPRSQGDPSIAHATMDFANRTTSKYLDQLLELPENPLRNLLAYSLDCLTAWEALPKRAAGTLWASLLTSSPTSDRTQGRLMETIQRLGPQLSTALINNIGGDATRSELDALCDPFKKLIFSQTAAKTWVASALFAPAFPSSRVDDAAKRRFIAQVIGLRGAKRTNAVVKEFWLLCRGTPIGYG